MQVDPAKRRTKYMGGSDDYEIIGEVAVETANGARWNVRPISVLKDTVSGTGTETITGMVPAGATLLAAAARVTKILAGAALTTWSLGETGALTRYGTTLALASGTTVAHANYVAAPAGTWAATARDIVLTAAAGVFTTGQVRVTIWVSDVTAPTS